MKRGRLAFMKRGRPGFMTRGRLAVLLAGLALAGVIIAAVMQAQSLDTKPVPRTVAQTFFTGYYPTTRLIDIDDVNLDAGEYRVSYDFDVVFTGPTPNAKLVCELKDPNGLIIRFDPDSTRTVPSSPAPQHVSFSGEYALPYVAVGVRCHTSVAGSVTAHFSRVKLTATRLNR
jgi:hypothetical protein